MAATNLDSVRGTWSSCHLRDGSEIADAAIGLRVAFVMSFCESFHPKRHLDDLTNKDKRDTNFVAYEKFRLVNNRPMESREYRWS